MKIQAIQSTINVNHKAKFINDNHGYLRQFWNSSEKDNELKNLIWKLQFQSRNHTLEIVNIENNANYSFATIFNHNTGANHNYKGPVSLKEMISDILKNNDFFDETTNIANMYKRLIGKTDIKISK